MKTTFHTIIFCMLMLLLAGLRLTWQSGSVVAEAEAAPNHAEQHVMMCSATSLVDPATATHSAIASGNWTDSATWQNGTLPSAGARVHIPVGMTVTVNDMIDHDLKHSGRLIVLQENWS